MFGMGFMEIMVIAIIAVIFLGPDKLPEAMMNVAKFFRSMKSTVADARDSLQQELNISELKQEALSYKEQLLSATDEIKNVTSLASLDDEMDDVKDTIASIDKTPTPKTPSMYAEASNKVQKSPIIPEQPKEEGVVTFEKKPKSVKEEKKEENN